LKTITKCPIRAGSAVFYGAVANPFANFRHLDVEIGSHPRLAAFVGRMLSRPSFSQWIERENALLAKVREPA